jgi:hypothetical protein
MDTAMMMARIFGPFLAIWGLWMLLYGDNVVKIMSAIKNSPAIQYCNSMITMFLGIYMIANFNMWMGNIFFFVTLLGWVFFLRGLLGLFVPHLVVRLLMTHTSWMKTMGIIPFVWGLILIWAGYYM